MLPAVVFALKFRASSPMCSDMALLPFVRRCGEAIDSNNARRARGKPTQPRSAYVEAAAAPPRSAADGSIAAELDAAVTSSGRRKAQKPLTPRGSVKTIAG